MTQKILITSALPYANGPLHFGHLAGAYLPADCYARFQRLMQQDVLYICGSDEYGIAITMSADLAGRTPKEHVDIFHHINRDFFHKLQISFDHYSRTTWEGHVEPTHQFFNDLFANGFIEERTTDQLYSESDHKFLADRYVVGTCPRCAFETARGDECPRCGASYEATELKNPRSKLTGSPLVRRPTKHWFLLLDKFKSRLMDWLQTKNWKPNVINFIKGYIDNLHPRAITRDSNWGISVPLPDSEGKVLYVWFDAPIGYISATKEWALLKGNPEEWKDYWMDPKSKLVNFIGKDNIPFHASIFPAMVMGQNQPYKLVDELPANEFYNLEGRQFSKSDGWYIDLEDFFQRYTSDQIRYAIASNAPETSDSEFTWKDFQLRCNSDLLGKYGNLVNRVLVFIRNQCDGIIPDLGDLEEQDQVFLNQIQSLVDQAAASYASFKVRRASQVFMELAQLGNIYFDGKKPWQDAKNEETRSRMKTTLACCIECLKALALISFPVIPKTANQLWHLLGYQGDIALVDWNRVKVEKVTAGQKILPPQILFQRVEDEAIEYEVQKLQQLSAAQKSKSVPIPAPAPAAITPLKPAIDIEDFRKLDLRVGVILKAEPVPKSKKLFKLFVDIGVEQRAVVAGVGEFYKAEDLIGRKVVVVANLKPAVLMGIESQGMLLAAKQESSLEILFVEGIDPGGIVS
ncbi:methionyl-tRNA synthetase [Candidatus Protochlamydia naegleriophila]|uniref:Methionine--tRNA ligase n=1 Tax=Candidatus Protochlamydia naegleriophila TaxID=389348 RepID=A0A0U5JCX4_9BACT|nr:methionine--tRNA ligase [Candidatus Protochlamydia naegleriophila]CUI16999.1 methionyl-tRNA synthetase [Candidatus Protochlamydia naegleriophila]